MNKTSAGLSWIQGSFMWGNIPAAKWMRDLQSKSRETYDHCVRVALMAERVGAGLKLPTEARKRLMHGCFLHDLGKLLLPRRLLDQAGPLSEAQWRMMKLHPELGAEILEMDKGIDPASIDIVKHHHERWDGGGYPYGLKGRQIPYLARICTVIDAFDSMVTARSYRTRLTYEDAKQELIRHSGTQFDEQIVRQFLALMDREAYLYE